VLQLLQSYRTGELRLADVPAPAVRAGSLLVRTRASLVSAGTERMIIDLARKSLLGKARERPDLVRKVLAKVKKEGLLPTVAAVRGRLDQPIPLGYSCVGEVMAVGEGVEGFAVGDRVACAGAGAANHAELNLVPKNLAARVPEGVPNEAAAFATVGSIALQGVRVAHIELGEWVAVIGLGLIGQLTVQLLAAAGARVIGVDVDPGKLEPARRAGAEVALARSEPRLVEQILATTAGHGVDAVLITAAAPNNDPIELSGEIARERGRVVAVGAVKMDVPRKPFYEKELELRLSRSYGPGRYDPRYEEQGSDYPYGYVRFTEQRNLESFLALCRPGPASVSRIDVAPLVTHRFPIARALDAYKLITEGGEPFIGVLLTYEGAGPARGSVRIGNGRAASAGTSGRLGLGVVGAGSFAGSVLIPAFARTDARLEAIASAGGITARHLGERFGFHAAATTLDGVLGTAGVDAVVLCTRHNLHADHAVRALRAGKHVFVEKPLALTEADSEAVLAAQAESARVLTVGFNRRFSALSTELRDRLARRREPVGIVYRVNAGPLPASHWTRDRAIGGGRILGEVCHFVDLCAFLVGVRLDAVSGAALGDDGCIATLRYADGSAASIVYATGGDPSVSKERVEVVGDGVVATIDDWRSLMVSEGGKERVRRLMSADKGHRSEAAAFVTACRTGVPPIAYDSLRETSLATLAIDRAVRGETPVVAHPAESRTNGLVTELSSLDDDATIAALAALGGSGSGDTSSSE
jgi:predicted dehydrogenase